MIARPSRCTYTPKRKKKRLSARAEPFQHEAYRGRQHRPPTSGAPIVDEPVESARHVELVSATVGREEFSHADAAVTRVTLDAIDTIDTLDTIDTIVNIYTIDTRRISATAVFHFLSFTGRSMWFTCHALLSDFCGRVPEHVVTELPKTERGLDPRSRGVRPVHCRTVDVPRSRSCGHVKNPCKIVSTILHQFWDSESFFWKVSSPAQAGDRVQVAKKLSEPPNPCRIV